MDVLKTHQMLLHQFPICEFKKCLKRKKFPNDSEVIVAATGEQYLNDQKTNLFWKGQKKLVEQCVKCFELQGEYMEMHVCFMSLSHSLLSEAEKVSTCHQIGIHSVFHGFK